MVVTTEGEFFVLSDWSLKMNVPAQADSELMDFSLDRRAVVVCVDLSVSNQKCHGYIKKKVPMEYKLTVWLKQSWQFDLTGQISCGFNIAWLKVA